MKVKYTGSRIGPGSERNIEMGEVFTVFQVGESYFHVLDENGAPVTLYEDEVALVNPPLNPPTPGKPEWMGVAPEITSPIRYMPARKPLTKE